MTIWAIEPPFSLLPEVLTGNEEVQVLVSPEGGKLKNEVPHQASIV